MFSVIEYNQLSNNHPVEYVNKEQLITQIAYVSGETKTRSKKFVDTFAEVVRTKLAEGENVNIADFGKFETVENVARTCRNPKTGEPLHIPARKAVKFRPGRLTRLVAEVQL